MTDGTKNEATTQDTAQNKPKLRKLPICARIVGFFVLLLLTAIIGAMIGYSVFGEGKAFDVFKPEVWQHIFDIKNGSVNK